MLRKGIYPYNYVDNTIKFEETVFPAKEHFFSILNESEISDDDCALAVTVWRELNIANLGEYTGLCVKTGVLLLADILQTFRKNCFQTYGLDMA